LGKAKMLKSGNWKGRKIGKAEGERMEDCGLRIEEDQDRGQRTARTEEAEEGGKSERLKEEI